MRVSINHEEVSKGFLRKKKYHEVHLKVDFTEEEKYIIDANGLTSTVILDRDCPADAQWDKNAREMDIWGLTIYQLLDKKPNVYAVATPLEAKKYEARLIEKLQDLKNFLNANAEIEQKSQTFEL